MAEKQNTEVEQKVADNLDKKEPKTVALQQEVKNLQNENSALKKFNSQILNELEVLKKGPTLVSSLPPVNGVLSVNGKTYEITHVDTLRELIHVWRQQLVTDEVLTVFLKEL